MLERTTSGHILCSTESGAEPCYRSLIGYKSEMLAFDWVEMALDDLSFLQTLEFFCHFRRLGGVEVVFPT
jgi:hypothetical protein